MAHKGLGWRDAMAVLGITLALLGCGSVIGIVWFHFDYAAKSWPLAVRKTSTGWRLSNPLGLQIDDLAMSGGRLIWSDGGCLQTFDVKNGRAMALQDSSQDYGSSAISSTYAAWCASTTRDETDLVSYNLHRHSRRIVARVPTSDSVDVSDVALDGTTLYWERDDPSGAATSWQIHAVSLPGGADRVIAGGVSDQLPTLFNACAGRLTWVQDGPGPRRSTIVVWDKTHGARGLVTMTADDKHSLDSVRLTTNQLIWLQERDTPAKQWTMTLTMLDLATGRRTLLTRGTDIQQFDAAGDVVLWEKTADDGTSTVVVHSLSTGSEHAMSDIGNVGGFVTDGTYLAWNGSDPTDFIQTAVIGH